MFKNLKVYYVLVALPYVLLLIGIGIFFDAIKRTVLDNPIPHLNYCIFFIVLAGGILILVTSRRLVRDAGILRTFSRAIHAKVDVTTLREMANDFTGDLACILQMIAVSSDRAISHQEQAALEHELANARSSLVRRNALPQYLTGLLVAMGLLGTFIGLLATLHHISILIGGFADLDVQHADPLQVFRLMIQRMQAPMSSMGIAFSTSMFGLLGSITLGLMMLGIRRLQGDIGSLLSSEVARHIEVALSFESISFRGAEMAGGINGESLDLTAKILLRIDERLAETARVRQRALSSEIDDFKKQRADMLRVLTEQTEASNSFRSELQQLGSQLGAIVSGMEKSNSTISSQISELTVRLAADARENHKLLATQVNEQRRLIDTLDSYNFEERLAETARVQQRALSAVTEDLKNQRADMLRTLAEQTEASRNFRGEIQQLGSQLGAMSQSMEKGSGGISAQISELTIHMAAEAKETQRMLNITSNNVRGELQQLGSQLGTMSKAMEKGDSEIATRIVELKDQLAADAMESQQRVDAANSDVRGELQQLGIQIGTMSQSIEKGDGEIATRIVELKDQLAADAMESQQRVDAANSDVRGELQQLGCQLDNMINATEKGSGEVAARIVELKAQLAADARESHQRLDTTNKHIRSELEQLGDQLGSIFNATEKGSGEIATRIADLKAHMAAGTLEANQQLDNVSNHVRSDLQLLGRQLGAIFNVMEKGDEEETSQLPELKVHTGTDDMFAPEDD